MTETTKKGIRLQKIWVVVESNQAGLIDPKMVKQLENHALTEMEAFHHWEAGLDVRSQHPSHAAAC